ncbi:MAG TPA: hypothetical protein PKY77_09135 [Phycisphaerae bacterium]|nr:hypothetical protein [Phycisphaerae bacterium]HRY68376.1 hypothetical protein [Phycisphaerae bacterium]HSA27793.1 hypothetical protein [Phycisphaerae bacterium]
MKRGIRPWCRKLAILILVIPLMQVNCLRVIQQETEVLFSPLSSPSLIYQSFLFSKFGPAIWQIIKPG